MAGAYAPNAGISQPHTHTPYSESWPIHVESDYAFLIQTALPCAAKGGARTRGRKSPQDAECQRAGRFSAKFGDSWELAHGLVFRQPGPTNHQRAEHARRVLRRQYGDRQWRHPITSRQGSRPIRFRQPIGNPFGVPSDAGLVPSFPEAISSQGDAPRGHTHGFGVDGISMLRPVHCERTAYTGYIDACAVPRVERQSTVL